MRLRTAALAIVIAASSAACGGGDGDDEPDAAPSTTAADSTIAAVVANFDLAAGSSQAFLLGLIGAEQESIAYGTVDLTFAYVGTAEEPLAEPRRGPDAEAGFVAVSGDQIDPDEPGPRAVSASDARGVYRTDPIVFPDAGFWEVSVAMELDGQPAVATAAFEVLAEHQVPAPGDEAPRTEQPLAGDPGVAPVAIDSRAQGEEPIPDPELHAVTVAEALQQARPLTVVISTPTYCTSRFCGPVTDTVGAVAARYADRMTFVHIEVWSDFENQEVSPAAAEWILQGEGGGNEPWIFVVDAGGMITHRFDNVVNDALLDAAVQEVLT